MLYRVSKLHRHNGHREAFLGYICSCSTTSTDFGRDLSRMDMVSEKSFPRSTWEVFPKGNDDGSHTYIITSIVNNRRVYLVELDPVRNPKKLLMKPQVAAPNWSVSTSFSTSTINWDQLVGQYNYTIRNT